MNMAYTFDIVLYPYGEPPYRRKNENGIIAIDSNKLYGYWEHRDGSEGGGLWFSPLASGDIELSDYDGCCQLPIAVINALRSHDLIIVTSEYDPE